MKYKIIIAILAVIFAAGAIGSVLVLSAPKKNLVRIKCGEEVLYTLDLNREADRTFAVQTDSGTNLVEIKDGKIRVQSADCPDKTCVRMGWLHSAAMPIVCLPHRLVIEFVDSDGGVDAIAE